MSVSQCIKLNTLASVMSVNAIRFDAKLNNGICSYCGSTWSWYRTNPTIGPWLRACSQAPCGANTRKSVSSGRRQFVWTAVKQPTPYLAGD